MRNNFENSQSMLQSADSKESADSARQNRPQVTFEQLKLKAKQRQEQQNNHKKIEDKERENADIVLNESLEDINENYITEENLSEFLSANYSKYSMATELSIQFFKQQNSFGLKITKNELDNHLKEKLGIDIGLSNEDKIKNYKEQLSTQGKSPTEILQTLIAKFENEEAVSTWVENWKNYLKLHQISETKSPRERRAIQKIIAKADFTNENSFVNSLVEISNSTELSAQTKFEISKEFDAQNISSVSGMDSVLNQIKSRKSGIEKAIEGKSQEKDSLQSEITNLENELEALSPDDPKAEELKKKLAEKKETLEQTETDIENLEKENPEEISFNLREGFSAKLNPNGNRTIKIEGSNFTIQLPDNALFMGRKNMFSINLAFTYKALNNVGMESLFIPQLNNNEVPDKNQRLFSNQILKELGYETDIILSQSSINQLEKDLSKLKRKGSNTTGIEDLTILGIWKISTQEVNTSRLKTCLNFIRQNRGREVEFEEIKEKIIN